MDEQSKVAEEQYVPGEWTCDACGFVMIKSIINAHSGNVGRDIGDHVECCPNDGMAMRRITMMEALREARDLTMDLGKRLRVAEETIRQMNPKEIKP